MEKFDFQNVKFEQNTLKSAKYYDFFAKQCLFWPQNLGGRIWGVEFRFAEIWGVKKFRRFAAIFPLQIMAFKNIQLGWMVSDYSAPQAKIFAFRERSQQKNQFSMS